jgi:hypothetical protein
VILYDLILDEEIVFDVAARFPQEAFPHIIRHRNTVRLVLVEFAWLMWRLTGEKAFDTLADVINYLARSNQSPDFRKLARMIMVGSVELTTSRIHSDGSGQQEARKCGTTKRLIHRGGIGKEIMDAMIANQVHLAHLLSVYKASLLLRLHYGHHAELMIFEEAVGDANP